MAKHAVVQRRPRLPARSAGGSRRLLRRRVHPLVLVLTTAVLGGFLLAVLTGLAAARRDLLVARSDLETARAALAARQTDAARAGLDGAQNRLRSAQRRGRTLPMRLLAPLPVLGSPVRAIAAVGRAGLEAAKAGHVILDASASFPTAASTTLDSADLRPIYAAAGRSRDALSTAVSHLDGARQALRGPERAVLPPVARVARRMQAEVAGARTQLAHGQRGLDVLAHLSSPDADLRILVLAQDSLELRPTGGYIGSYGVLRFSQATVVLERYEATESLPPPEPPPDPPPDLAPFLPGPWRLSNVNWWPDFPTSARAAAEMFRRQGGGDVGGVLALTEHALASLVGAVGPLQVPGYSEPVTEKGLDERLVYEIELKKPQDVPRKRFLIELARVLFDRVFHVPQDRLPALTAAVQRSTGNGDIQLWFEDPVWEGRLDGTVVAGALPRTNGDFLLLADANMAATKANLGVAKHATYRVSRQGDGTLRARLEIVVTNDRPASALNPGYESYLRVYVPSSARILTRRAHERGDPSPEGPYQVLSRRISVPPLERRVLTFDYVLPASLAAGGQYRLTWARQPGTPRDSYRVIVGARETTAGPEQRTFHLEQRVTPNGPVGWLRDRWLATGLGLWR